MISEPVLAQQVMSSGTYKIQSDSVNFAGAQSTSSSYSLEDTLGEISTGNISSNSYAAQIGYQAMIARDRMAPTPPSSISAIPVTTSQIEVVWGESTDNTAVTRYFVYRDGVRVSDAPIFPRSFLDSGLSANTLYAYNVSAVDDAGNESLWSATTTARTFKVTTNASARAVTLSDLVIIPTDTKALVSFKSGAEVQTTISWGTDTNYASGSQTEEALSSDHIFVIESLNSSTNYYLKIVMTRADGFVSTYENIQFRTLSVSNIILPPNVLSFSAFPMEKSINLSWTMPVDVSLVGVKIVRSKDFYPSSPMDGEVIFEGRGESFIDIQVTAGVRYYYSIFTKDFTGNYSSGAIADARILVAGQVEIPISPLEGLQMVGVVHPMIAQLRIEDFLFIQDGNSLKVENGVVAVDGQKNLVVALQYYRLPPVLKTIAVTLVTSDSQSFTFILRLNKDKTRYEATVASLGKTNTYIMKIVIADFKNQGLKKLRGTMVVFGEMAPFNAQKELGQILGWLVFIILLIILLGSLRKKLERFVYRTEENREKEN